MVKTPPVIQSKKVMKSWSRYQQQAGETIAFVPTMGSLHQGHLSLVELAGKKCSKVVVSIFVNPTQFAPNEDFQTYPRELDSDLEKLASLGVDIVFAPSTKEMSPKDPQSVVTVSGLTSPLCGASRAGHFNGVTTVVAKLFNIVEPDIAVFGQKDYQQLVTIRKMVDDLDFMIEIVCGETVRELDGLAMSSRNSYLSPEERANAPEIYRSLLKTKELIKTHSPKEIEQSIFDTITKGGAVVEYVNCLDANTLKPINNLNNPMVVATAAYYGKTRLIDNIIISNRSKKA
jgi:pantoate--beta-alanine ligase